MTIVFRFLAAAVRDWAVLPLACVVLVALAALTGCAAQQNIKPNASVAIAVSHAPGWPGAGKVKNESVGGSSPEALAGAGAGALAGGAWGLACGPLAALCVPLGVVAGADLGVLAGWAVGTTAALPEDKADQLRDRVTRALQSHDLRSALETEVVDRATNHWNVNSGLPTVTVDVELRELVVSSTRDERIRCAVKVAVTVRDGDISQPRQGVLRVYEYVSPYGSLASWLDEGSGLVEANLAGASRHLATQIVSGLAGKP